MDLEQEAQTGFSDSHPTHQLTQEGCPVYDPSLTVQALTILKDTDPHAPDPSTTTS